jgi:hypothetical protein
MIERLLFLGLGGIAIASLAIATFFFRFWRASRDRFFLFFALSFVLQAVDRVGLALLAHPNEGSPFIYGVRLVAYLLILVAIWEKNSGSRR